MLLLCMRVFLDGNTLHFYANNMRENGPYLQLTQIRAKVSRLGDAVTKLS